MATEGDFEQHLLAQFDHWGVYLHEDQSYLGRTYVALERGKDDQEMDPFLDTTRTEKDEFELIYGNLSTALDELYQPTRLNPLNLRNRWRRCHWHIIPRYEGLDMGLRVVSGFDFHDMRPGQNPAPSPEIEVPPKVFSVIKTDITEALQAARSM